MIKAKFIKRTNKSECYRCRGTGLEDIENITNITKVKNCKACKGRGYWIENSYFLIYTDKKGLKQAFTVDGIN